MPLVAGIPDMANAFLPLFDPGESTTVGAARIWASAYFRYTLKGNVTPVPPRERILAADLTAAFNPELLGGGRALFLVAIAKYWLGTPATVPPGVVSIFIPSGSIDSDAATKQGGFNELPPITNPQGHNKRCVWKISTKSSPLQSSRQFLNSCVQKR